MDSVELYRTLDCGWVECGGLRLASSEERWEETRRQAGWAKTFGLPLELLSRRRGAGALPADDHRRRARRLVAADRRLPRPEPAHLRARRGRARGRLRHPHQHARDRDRRPRRARAGRRRPSAATSRPRWSSTRAACSRPRSGAWRACACRSCRWRTSTSSRSRSGDRSRRDEHAPDHARPRPPHLLPRGRRRARDGRLRAPLRRRGRSTRTASTRSPPTSTAACSRRTGSASRRSPSTPASACR